MHLLTCPSCIAHGLCGVTRSSNPFRQTLARRRGRDDVARSHAKRSPFHTEALQARRRHRSIDSPACLSGRNHQSGFQYSCVRLHVRTADSKTSGECQHRTSGVTPVRTSRRPPLHAGAIPTLLRLWETACALMGSVKVALDTYRQVEEHGRSRSSTRHDFAREDAKSRQTDRMSPLSLRVSVQHRCCLQKGTYPTISSICV